MKYKQFKKWLFSYLLAIFPVSASAYVGETLALWVQAMTPLAILQLLKLSPYHFDDWVDLLVSIILPAMVSVAPNIIINDQVTGIATDLVAEALQRVIDTNFGVLL